MFETGRFIIGPEKRLHESKTNSITANLIKVVLQKA